MTRPTRLLWFALGAAVGTAITICNAILLGYVPCNSTH